MRKNAAFLSALFFLAFHLSSSAQIAMSIQMGKPDKGVLGLPVSADESVRTLRHLANGSLSNHEIQGHYYRSADGVERYEASFPSNDPDHPDPTTLVYIIDHERHNSILLNSHLKTATIQSLPANAAILITLLPLQSQPQDPRVRPQDTNTTDLGKRTEDMWELHGRRIIGTIPAGKGGNDAPLTVTTEVWVSQEIKITVKQSDENPFSGERTMQLSNIRREEPSPALFQVPEGYTIKTRAAIPDVAALPQLLHPPSPASPEQRTKQIEDALNSPDPGVKNNVAYALALNRDHLTDAQLLAEQAVALKEQQVADAVSGNSPAKSFDQMVYLSRFWDTTGYVFYRAGHPEKAEPYLRGAWELNPNSEFAIHLGLAYESEHKNQQAVTIYRMALSAKPSPAIQDALQTRLTNLGQPNAQSLAIDIVTPLPTLKLQLDLRDDDPLVDIVLSHSHPPTVTFLKGKSAVKQPVTQAIETALASGLPDDGPELVIRQARVICISGDTPACTLHFTNTREFTAAEQARRDTLRSPLP